MSVPRKPRPKSIIQDGKKLCLHCNTFKALAEFNDNKRSADGKQPYCRPCTNSRSREWRINNAAVVQKNNRDFRERRPEYGLEWQRANSDLMAGYIQDWRDKNPMLHKASDANAKARVRYTDLHPILDDATTAYIATLMEQENCYYCRRFVLVRFRSIDHKTPVVRGGRHSKDNLCMACIPCNTAKNNQTEFEYRWYSGYDK